jgi:hypothetical protein
VRSATSKTDHRFDLPALPASVVSFDGQVVGTDQPSWLLRSSADGGKLLALNWSRLDDSAILTQRARYLAKLFLADKLSRKKARTIENDFRMFSRFQRWLRSIRRSPFEWSDLTEGIARGFLTHGLKHTADKGNDFSRLRTFYRWGVARQYPDFDLELFHVLRSVTATGNAKGHHVRFRDTVKGPFSPDELLLISKAIKQRSSTDEDRAIVMLHLELGNNPNASARLQNRDLIRYEAKIGVAYHLGIPRLKKRTALRETKQRPISENLGQLLETLRTGAADDALLHWLSQTNPEAAINRAMRRFVRAAGLISPRTQRLMKINSRRFRFSIATHMAEEGASAFHIAEVLDHSDTQNVRVYVETASSIVDSVAKATDAALAPLVQRFRGKIVDSLGASAFNGLPNQVIPAVAPDLAIFHPNVGGIGMCGRDTRKEGLCRLLPPLSCYLCPSFAALRHGPHEEMLNSIETFIQHNEAASDQRILMQLGDVRIVIREVLKQLGDDEGCSHEQRNNSSASGAGK